MGLKNRLICAKIAFNLVQNHLYLQRIAWWIRLTLACRAGATNTSAKRFNAMQIESEEIERIAAAGRRIWLNFPQYRVYIENMSYLIVE